MCYPPLSFFVTMQTRTTIRDKYGIKEAPCQDLLVHLVSGCKGVRGIRFTIVSMDKEGMGVLLFSYRSQAARGPGPNHTHAKRQNQTPAFPPCCHCTQCCPWCAICQESRELEIAALGRVGTRSRMGVNVHTNELAAQPTTPTAPSAPTTLMYQKK